MFDKIKQFINSIGNTTNEEKSIIDEAETIVEEEVYTFKVAGISFHYKELDKIIKSLLDEGVIEKYCGYTNKDILESGEGMTIFQYQYVKGVKLDPYTYEGKDAIKVILPDYKGKWYEVGNVPKKNLKDVIDLLNNQEKITNIEFTISGGAAKYVNEDEDDKPYLVDKEYEYGVNIHITYNK